MNKNIVFLASGNGGTLKFLYYAIKELKLEINIIGIIADRNCGAISFAQKKGIKNCIIEYNKTYNQELIKALSQYEADLIITNIHKIIDNELLNLYPDKFINLHYSLLPAYKGLFGMETVKKAKLDNVQFIGGTCHKVTSEIDGGKILSQGIIPVNWTKSMNDIYNDVFRVSCLSLLNAIFLIFKIKLDANINVLDTNIMPKPQFNIRIFTDDYWKQIL